MRLQSAFEYLTTYGWAILIILVALGILAALGLFNPNNFSSTQCVTNGIFTCETLYLSNNGLMSITLLQSGNAPVLITAYGCTQSGSITNMQTPANQIYVPIGGTSTVSIQCYTSNNALARGNVGTTFTGSVIINYTDEETGIASTELGKFSTAFT